MNGSGPHRQHRALELGVLAVLLLQYHPAFIWLFRTWTEATYESWGPLALLVALAGLRRWPARRDAPSRPHLVGILALSLLDLVAAALRINVVSAGLGLISLHLCLVAFRAYRGRWFLQPQLWLALLCLPVVHWANVLFGFELQHLVSRLAALSLSLYGLPIHAEGTLLQVGEATVAVDTSCSGLKLLYSGLLLGLLIARTGEARRSHQIVFWGALLLLLLGANVVRVVSLAVAHLVRGQPLGVMAHQGVGLVAFAMVLGVSLVLWRWLTRDGRVPCPA